MENHWSQDQNNISDGGFQKLRIINRDKFNNLIPLCKWNFIKPFDELAPPVFISISFSFQTI